VVAGRTTRAPPRAAAASVPIKVQVFNHAWQVRSENWRDSHNKEKLERVIPVFRALISDDTQDRFHMNHGQLGFALKDKLPPDWDEAEKELTRAIEIRGSSSEHGWLFYEFNRAYCRIMSDPAYVQGHSSGSELRAKIIEDLQVAAQAEDVERIMESDPVIKKWMHLNSITHESLRTG